MKIDVNDYPYLSALFVQQAWTLGLDLVTIDDEDRYIQHCLIELSYRSGLGLVQFRMLETSMAGIESAAAAASRHFKPRSEALTGTMGDHWPATEPLDDVDM